MNAALRSVLYIPAANPRALAKAASLACDAVILDLEDAVAPQMKAEARVHLRAAFEAGTFADKRTIIRVNGFEEDGGCALLDADLAELVPCAPAAFLFPKIARGADLDRVMEKLESLSVAADLRIWAMIERPAAILALPDIVTRAQGARARLSCLVMGTNDLAKEMRLPAPPSRRAMVHALCASVMAARAAGLDVLDGVFGDIGDSLGFEMECREGRELGFDGKTLIHPGQIEIANRVFSPSEAELRMAQAIVAAFEAPENAGKGVITVEGRMTERLHYDMAKRIARSG